jgi:type II secretion system protein N
MSERTRRLIRWIGYPSFSVFILLTFLYLSLPYDKLKARIEDQVSASGDIELEIGSLGPRPLLGLSASGVVIKMKQKDFDPQAKKKKDTRILLDEAVVKFGLIALIAGGVDVSFDVTGLGGEVEGTFSADKKKSWSFKGEVSKINLARLPILTDTVGLPFAGLLSSKIDLSVLQDRWSDSAGLIEIDCEGGAIGDGKAKLKIPGNAFLAAGLTLPKVRLGRIGGQIKVEKGTASFQNVTAQSPDIEIAVEGSITLRSPLAYSLAQLYIRFKISPDLKKRDPVFELLEGNLNSARRSDGFYGIQLVGPLKTIRPIPSAIGPRGTAGAEPARGRLPAALRTRSLLRAARGRSS